jgi:hypothetical protein
MTFAGLSNPQDRANVIAFLNAHSDARCRFRPHGRSRCSGCRRQGGRGHCGGPQARPQKAEESRGAKKPAAASPKPAATRPYSGRALRSGCGAGCSS